LKAKEQNQTRPARYRARNPPQPSGKCRLSSSGAAMNFIANVRLKAKKSPCRDQPAGEIIMNWKLGLFPF
jgi:hypothetical protein